MSRRTASTRVFFFNDTATTEIYTLSLHDALPISAGTDDSEPLPAPQPERNIVEDQLLGAGCRDVDLQRCRSEEHTSELQSHLNLVCRLLLEKKNGNTNHGPRSFTTIRFRCSRLAS